MVQVQDNKNDVGTIKQINKTYKHSMREVTETDSPPLLLSCSYFCLEYAVHCTWYFSLGLYSRHDMYHLLVTIIRLFPDVIFLPQIQVKGR